MLKGIEHIVWDWNGTLLDDVDAALLSINTMLQERAMPVLNKTRYREIFGFPVIECYRLLGFEFSTHEEWDAIATEFHGHYNRNVSGASLTAGVTEALESLSARGIAMSILSASEEGKLIELLRHYGIDNRFAHIMGHSDLYGSSKIELGRRLTGELGLDPDKVLLVGDTVHDFEVAMDSGWKCVLYLGGHQDPERLMGCGCPTLSAFDPLFRQSSR